MKTLINARTTVSADGKTATIVVDVADYAFNALLTTRVSHGHLNPDNPKHPRRIQSSNQAVFLEAPGFKGSIPNETIAAIWAVISPASTFAPVMAKAKDGSVKAISELPVSFQWQSSPDDKTWTDIAGQTSQTLPDGIVAVGEWKRLIISNAKGNFITKPVQIPKVK